MSENNGTYQATYEPTGRVWTLRPVPKHVFLMFGYMPSHLTEKAVAAMQANDELEVGKELLKTANADETLKSMLLLRKALEFAIVSPKIADPLAEPKENEISALEIDDDEFNFLVRLVKSGGGAADRLNSFRGKSGQVAGSRVNGTKRTKKRK